MQNATLVRVVDRPGNRFQVSRRTPSGERLLLDEPCQVGAIDKVHHQIMLARVYADFVNGDDVGVLQTGCAGRLRAKTLHELRAGLRAE